MEEKEETMVYNMNDLAQKLKISKSMAYQLARNRDFPKVRIGKRIIVPVKELRKWLSEQSDYMAN